VIFKPTVPVENYDIYSDNYSWDWGGLHLVQMHRFAGDTRKGAASGIPWLKQDLAANAADGRPVIIFQHYGWDSFSIERWDPARAIFDDADGGQPHWWTDEERRTVLETIDGYNVIAIFHGHQHDTPMIYKVGDLDLFKPKAGYMGGFAIARVSDSSIDVVLGEARPPHGDVIFTNAFSKAISFGTSPKERAAQ
jgi:cytolysin (calcineurin-like family phosphatase)